MNLVRRFLVFLPLALLLQSGSAFSLANNEVALILMHGKWGSPPGPLAGYLAREGFHVVSPTMPWSVARGYEPSYRQAVDELHRQVEQLRSRGAKKVVIGGVSFGANGALAYAATYQDVDALLLFAPGHVPESFYRRGITRKDVDRAAELVAQGKGEERITFTDQNQDKSQAMNATAANFLSYFAPPGLGNMGKNAAAIGKSIPVLLVNSSAEVKTQGRDYIFAKLPANARSVYIESSASHAGAPEAATREALQFLRSVMED